MCPVSLVKVTGGRLAPSTRDIKVTSPVTMWRRPTPFRLKSKNLPFFFICIYVHSCLFSLVSGSFAKLLEYKSKHSCEVKHLILFLT